jgi:drug/metabolite transporter (DMT)-like permease
VVALINPLAGRAPDLLASGVALGGALFWGCGSVYARRAPHPGQPLLASGMEMICAGVALCLIGAASGELGRILLHHASSQLAGTYAFVSPLVAVVLGWWLLGEQISEHTLLAAAAIAAGVALIMLRPRKPGPGPDETGDRPPEQPAAQVPAAGPHQLGHPAGGAPGISQCEPGSICCCDWAAP